MTEQNITVCHRGWRLESSANVLGIGLSFSAVIAACCIGFFTETTIPVEHPAILVLASFFVLVPFKSKTPRHSNKTKVSNACHSERSEESQCLDLTETLRFAQGDKRVVSSESLTTLQKIICFYLFSVIISQISAQYFPVSISFASIDISYSIVPLVLCASGYFAGKVNTKSIRRIIESKNIFYVWIIALAIIIVHIIFLSLVLNKFYGYGYERNLSTVGNLMLYLLLFILLWEKLGNLRFRRSVGLVLALFYLTSIFMNK